jgi:hypothetical protein
MCVELPLTFLLHLLHLLLQLHGAGEVPSLLGSMPMSSLVKMLNLLVVAGAASSTAVAGLVKLQQRVCLHSLRVHGGICGE